MTFRSSVSSTRCQAPPRRTAFLQLNTAFASDAVHQISGWSNRAVNPPLSDWYMRLTSEGATPDTRPTAADVLDWARNHIQLSKPDAAAIDAAIQEHVGDSGSPPAEASLRGRLIAVGNWLIRIGKAV